MKKKLCTFFVLIFTSFVLVMAGLYISIAVIYSNGFTYGTYVNGVYCTGLDIYEADNKLKRDCTPTCITVSSEYFDDETVLLRDINFDVSFYDELYEIYTHQNPWKWPENLFLSMKNTEIAPKVTFDDGLLRKHISLFNCFNQYPGDNFSYGKVIYEDGFGYSLFEKKNVYLEPEEVYDAVIESFKSDYTVNVDSSFFHDAPLSDESNDEYVLWNELSDVLNRDISIDMGDELILLDVNALSKMIKTDSKGQFLRDSSNHITYDENKVSDYIDKLCAPYNTYGKSRDYMTYSGEIKHIELSTYGNELNTAKLKDAVFNRLINNDSGVVMPEYIHEGFCKGKNDIGYTFVEVDLSRQHMYYVLDGTLFMDFEIVSGKPLNGNETPEVVCNIKRKSKNRYLRGEGYVSFVNFWIPFYKADGFHDASWQKEFGGERYLRYGSHGCINMRYDDAKSFYEAIEEGTPVIVYK